MRKYRLVAKKGEGTFSEVLKAQNVKDGKYHAILSEMGGGVGLKLWTCASRIVHATSTDPLTEPFKRERVLFDSFAHEPRCASVPDAASAFVCFFAYNPLGGPQLGLEDRLLPRLLLRPPLRRAPRGLQLLRQLRALLASPQAWVRSF